MKKIVIIIMVLLLGFTVQAQIKLHQSGQISFGTLSDSWAQGIQFIPGGCVHFNNSNSGWSWVTMASTASSHGKCWIVSYPDKNTHTFCVTGEGAVYYTYLLSLPPANQNNASPISAPNSIINGISGYYFGSPDSAKSDEERKIGLMAEEIKEVLPEALRTDDKDRLCIDYNAITSVLVEAVKEQQKEIGRLRQALENNGITIPDE